MSGINRGIVAALCALIAVGAAAPAANAATDLYPDLKTLPPRDLHLTDAWVEGTDGGGTGSHNVIRFTNTVWNAGDGDLIIRGDINPATKAGPGYQRVTDSAGGFTEKPAGDFKWHAGNHNHFHYEGWGRYELWTKAKYEAWLAGGRQAAALETTGVKTTSCVLDEEFIKDLPGTRPNQTYTFNGCLADNGQDLLEGMQRGWGDTYDYWRDDQWIDLGPNGTLANGDYVLRSVTDPTNQIYESPNKADALREAAENNDAVTYFRVQNNQIVDTDTPTGSVWLDNLATSTSKTNVILKVVGRDDVSGINAFRVSNDGLNWKTFRYAENDNANTSLTIGSTPVLRDWSLTDPAYGGSTTGGEKTVYVQFRDGSPNGGKWGATFEDKITMAGPGPSTGYSGTIRTDNPAGFWRLGEPAGSVIANDDLGTRHGRYYSSPAIGVPGLLGTESNTATQFDGVDDIVSIPNDSGLNFGSALTLEAWIKPDTLPLSGGLSTIVTRSGDYSLHFDGPYLSFVTWNAAGNYRETKAPLGAIQAGRAYHVAATYDGATMRLYIDGTLVASTAASGAVRAGGSPLTIGSRDWSGFYDGTIDEVAVYPSALSQARLLAHIDAANPIAQAPAAPSGLNVTAKTASSVTLGWNDNSNNESAFRLERSADANFTTIDFQMVGQDLETFTDTKNLLPNATYYYRLRAQGPQGASAWSATTSVTTSSAPAVVTTGMATATTDRAATLGGSVDPRGTATQYWFEYRKTGTTTWTATPQQSTQAVRNVASVSASVTGLSSATGYDFRLRTTNAGGAADGITATFTTSPLPAPSNLGGGATTSTTIPLTWTDNSADETGIEVQLSTSSDFSTGVQTATKAAGAISHTFTALNSNRTYYARVRAVKTGAQSAWSSTLSRTTAAAAPLATTSALQSDATDRSATLVGTVDPRGSAGEWWFEYRTLGASTWTATSHVTYVAGWSAIAASQNVTGLSSGTVYEYRVRATNSTGTADGDALAFATLDLPAPSNLGGGATGATSVPLSWNDNSADETGFEIQRASSNTFADAVTITTTAPNATSYTDSGRAPNATYWYRVRAVKSGTESDWSNVISRTTGAVAPLVTLGAATDVNDRSAKVAGSVTPRGTVTQYWFEYRKTADPGWTALAKVSVGSGQSATNVSATLTGLASGTPYTYRLRAESNAGTTDSSTDTFTTAALPAPSNLGGGTATSTTVPLSWTRNSADETGFEIQRASSNSFADAVTVTTTAAGATSYTDTGRDPNVTYWYRVRAVKTGAQSGWSNSISRTTGAVAPAVTLGASSDVTDRSAKLAGTVNPRGTATQYWFEYRRTADAGWTALGKTSAGAGQSPTAVSADLTGLSAGTSYTFRLRAESTAGTTDSSTDTFTTALSPVAAPSGLTAGTAERTSVALSWTDNANDETGFELQRASSDSFAEAVTITRGANLGAYTDTGLTEATVYWYRLRAVRGGDVSSWSNAISVTTAQAPHGDPDPGNEPPAQEPEQPQQPTQPQQPSEPQQPTQPTTPQQEVVLPKLTLSIPRQRLEDVLKRGLKVQVKATKTGKLELVVRVDRKVLGLRGPGAVTIGTAKVDVKRANRTQTVVVKLKSTYRKKLARRGRAVGFKIEGTVADADGNESKPLFRSVTVKPQRR